MPRRSPALLALAGLALALTACGARVDSSLRSEAANQQLGRNGAGSTGGGAVDGSTGSGTTGTETTGSTGTSGTATTGSSGTSGTTGTSGTSGSSTSGTAGTSGAPAPAGGNGGATDVGVTGNSITVGLVADSSGPVPGLFRGAFVGAQAYFAKVNSEGGVFGRQIKIDFGDSQLDCGQNKSATQARVGKVFAFVGNFSLNDDCGEQVLAQHPEVPNVSNALGPKTAALPQTFSTAPLGNGWRTGPLAYYAKTYGAKWQHIGAIYAGVGTGPTVWSNTKKAIDHSGGKVVHDESYGATDTDFTGAIIRMKSAGVQLTYINTTDGATTARFVNAARSQNVDWPLIFGATAYDSNFLQQAGNNAEGVINDQQFAMFFNTDEAAKIPAVKDFQKWMNYVNSDQTKDIFAAYGWTSAQLFTDALKKAGAKAQRKTLFSALRTFTNYDAGGIFAPANPAQKKPAVCWIIDKVQGGKFVRIAPSPSTGFYCTGASYYHRPGDGMEFLQLLIVGLVTGCVYALSATGLVVTYTTSGIFNFAHGAIGMLGAFMYWQLTVSWSWPTALALPAVLLVLAPLFGAAVERVLVRPLHGASVDVTLVITLGLLLFLLGAANYIWDPAKSRVLPQLFKGGGTSLFGVNLSSQQILIVVVAVAVAVALKMLFSRTRIGIAMRGVVDDPDLCAMSGASPARIQQLSWAIGASLASLAGILIAPKVGLSSIQLTLLVINGYAAALFGRLKSLPRTAVGGILLGIVVEMYPVYIAPHVPSSQTATELTKAVPMIFLGVLLLFLPSARLRTSTAAGRIAPTVPGLRQSLVGGVGLVVVAVLLTSALSSENLGIATNVVVLAIAMLSLVLLTGYSGQTSLCVLTFVGLGAWAMGHAGHSVLGLLWGALLAGAAGALVALATARLRGLYLALATFAFAKGMDEAFFYFHLGSGQQLEIQRFRLPGLDTDSPSTYFLLCSLVLAAASVAVLAVRRGRWGRQLTALNDSPAACATLGVNTTVTKVVVFTASAAMAGFAGGLYGSSRGIVTNNDFAVLGSLALLLAVRVGGINTITGAVFGALTITMFPEIQKHVHGLPDKLQLAYLLTGLAAVSVGRDPDGLGGQFSKLGHRLRSMRTPPSSSASGAPSRESTVEEARLVHS